MHFVIDTDLEVEKQCDTLGAFLRTLNRDNIYNMGWQHPNIPQLSVTVKANVNEQLSFLAVVKPVMASNA